MLPYCLVYPLIVLASVAFPVLCSLNSLQKKDANEQKVWLFYWLGYVLLTVLINIPGLDVLLQLPFDIIASIMFDIYYETGLVLAILLVNPKKRYLDVLVDKAEVFMGQHGEKVSKRVIEHLEVAKGQVAKGVDTVRKRVNDAKSKAVKK
eukprot:GEMP01086071.1.p1 GENE.GEMP01086071.1~~GEMP01086071.1.p1  ORF type:complete len:150 (+),score=22.07 GEMP01086071.1:136-585(+)